MQSVQTLILRSESYIAKTLERLLLLSALKHLKTAKCGHQTQLQFYTQFYQQASLGLLSISSR